MLVAVRRSLEAAALVWTFAMHTTRYLVQQFLQQCNSFAQRLHLGSPLGFGRNPYTVAIFLNANLCSCSPSAALTKATP